MFIEPGKGCGAGPPQAINEDNKLLAIKNDDTFFMRHKLLYTMYATNYGDIAYSDRYLSYALMENWLIPD